ncbi:MAG: bifunctional methylenetetrahydrofolate dehydrogenase/methenyltetrahydrofolate cyclohydrolase FolD [Calditrichaeota bacterium]|nr:MAG: bifunctional methylenetetrahydrofolate dehydrogenase/methenyltetrahydrofolate cyclohydrolase FolD [Calditrichota bacterium]MBL1204164.1 bifunctional methylenetetrahydrofolate dehydrogenase/methenyltetrahydrofolate cyclohydrolase FolD [Calditrichota bacterium]NOG43995.1 bifunctional methylenetetrahydrofolate dehydrogenase/methenyltetrahydrofolate cyclohydrolase FolD [Calditrichota bacterium]
MDSSKILNGKEVAEFVNQRNSTHVELLKEKNIQPGLVVVLVGDDPASAVYVRSKGRMCEKLGILSSTHALPEETSESDLLQLIDKLNKDDKYNGILVQLPLPKHIDEQKVIEAINPLKDVDCFHPKNVGLLTIGSPYLLPCTPAGIVEILKYYKIETSGKEVVVIGRSNIVGKPVANILLQKSKFANATVTIVHSRTQDIKKHTANADIIVAAIGQANFLTSDMIKEGAVIIDVGINRVDDPTAKKGYRLKGDVDYDSVFEKSSAITPVPGGVGPMTIGMLMHNTIIAAAKQNGVDL